MADPATCTLYTTETVQYDIDLPSGKELKLGGPVTPDDLHTHIVETDTTSFKQVEKIVVVKMQDVTNQSYARSSPP
jgi:putative AlgH/UPF0301 family transcriptional regulator